MVKIMEISIIKRKLMNWVYKNNFTPSILAKRLNLPLQEMKDKLENHAPFTREQIEDLVYFMGASDAFEVMYFPTLREKRRIKYEAFIKHKEYDE